MKILNIMNFQEICLHFIQLKIQTIESLYGLHIQVKSHA
jgi:hypothetical protein